MHTLIRSRWIALVVLTAVEFMILLDTSIVNVALPAIKSGLHLSEADLSWVMNVYQLIFGGFLLLGGRAADLFGRRKLYLLGLALFTLGSLLAGLAPGAELLLVARALQGLGAAIVIPAEQSLLVTIFTDPAEFNRAFGIWSAMGAAGAASGVVLGGVLTQFLGWPWIFLINVPVGIVVLLLSPRLLPESRNQDTDRQLDLLGAGTITTAVLLFSYVPLVIPDQGWSWLSSGALLLAIILLALFVWIESHATVPLVPLHVFRRRNANGANIVSFLVGASHAPMFYFLSLYLQQVLGFDALAAGLAILPVALINMAISGTVLSKALQRLGFKGVLIAGMLLLAFGLALFARAPVPGSYLFDVLPACFIVAVGLPAAFVGTNIAAVNAAKPAETGLVSGLVNTMQRLGSGIGIAILTALAVGRTSTVATHTSQQALALGFQAAFLGAAFLALVGAFVALTLIQRPQGNQSTSDSEQEESCRHAVLD